MARFDCANWRPISTNTGGNMSSQRGLVLHHQAGNGSLYGFFNNPAAKVSAHFWVAKNGTIEQYVDTAKVAWHGRDLNSNWVGVETEGCPGGRDEPMTDAMFNALVRLYREGNRRHGWPNQLASSNGGRGFGYHRMAVNTACPCDVRLNRRSAILAQAFGSGGGATPAPPAQEVDVSAAVAYDRDGLAHFAWLAPNGAVMYFPPGRTEGYAVDPAQGGAKSGVGIAINAANLVMIAYTNGSGAPCSYHKPVNTGSWVWTSRGKANSAR
jgi:hypothetical protein